VKIHYRILIIVPLDWEVRTYLFAVLQPSILCVHDVYISCIQSVRHGYVRNLIPRTTWQTIATLPNRSLRWGLEAKMWASSLSLQPQYSVEAKAKATANYYKQAHVNGINDSLYTVFRSFKYILFFIYLQKRIRPGASFKFIDLLKVISSLCTVSLFESHVYILIVPAVTWHPDIWHATLKTP